VFESTWSDASLSENIKKGYFTRPDGSKFIILTETISDRLTGQTYTIKNEANIVIY
jgi:hypothetical protein